RPDRMHLRSSRRQRRLLSRDRPRPRLHHQAPLDARALLDHPDAYRDHARRPDSDQPQAARRRLSVAGLHWSDMAELKIQNLHVRHEEREILHGVDLVIRGGEIHALMGPNGSGKSTLANTIMGHPSYEVTEGSIVFNGDDITEAPAHERARAGLFLAFQYPVAVPGVSVANFLRMAINAKRDEPIKVKEFGKQLAHAVQL